MKHPLAVAVHNGYTAALGAAVQNGDMSIITAREIEKFAARITVEYLLGTSMFGHTLDFFASDGQMYDDMLTRNKINLATKWGET